MSAQVIKFSSSMHPLPNQLVTWFQLTLFLGCLEICSFCATLSKYAPTSLNNLLTPPTTRSIGILIMKSSDLKLGYLML